MTSAHGRALSTLERRNGQVFLLAAVLMAGVATYKGVMVYTPYHVPSVVDIAYGGVSLLAPVLAMLGLHPRLREVAPRLSTAGATAALVAAAAVVTILTWFVATTLQLGRFPVIPEEVPVWAALALFLVFITLALGFLLFGVVGLRSTVLAPRVGLLLVVPAVMWLGLIVTTLVPGIDGMAVSFYVYVVNAVTFLAIGRRIRTGSLAPDRGEAAVA